MHILFLSHYFPPEVNAPATRTFEHCRRWVRAGHRVTVITCAPNCPTGRVFAGYKNGWRREEWVQGIRVVRVWTYLAANKGFSKRILNYLSYMLRATLAGSAAPRFDLVVATSPQFFCGWAGALVSWIRRRPFVLEVRDIWPDSIVAVDAMRKNWLIRLLERLEARLYRAAGHIVTVGEDYRRNLLGKGVPAEKIAVVANGVDFDSFSRPQRPSSIREELNSVGKFVCAYVGTVGMAHGLEVVLQAAEQARAAGREDLMFWIVGDGARREELQSEAQRRGLANVVFTGLLAKERMPEVISACDAGLVHLKGNELFTTVLPSKIFEFMALEVPIIIGVRGQAQEIVLESGAGLAMVPDDAGSLLSAIAQIQAQGRAAFCRREYALAHYDRDRLAEKMLQVLVDHQRAPAQPVLPASAPLA